MVASMPRTNWVEILGVPSCIMPRLPTHLVLELNASTGGDSDNAVINELHIEDTGT